MDYVSEEAERAGLGAAGFVQKGNAASRSLATKPGFGVRYVLPQTVHVGHEDVALFLRVTEPFGRVKFTIKSGDAVLATAKRLRAAPGEMEKLILKAENLKNVTEPIVVSLEVAE